MHTLDPVWREMLPSHVCSNPIQYPAEAGWEVCGQWQFVLVIPDSLKKQLGEKQHTRLVIIVVVLFSIGWHQLLREWWMPLPKTYLHVY